MSFQCVPSANAPFLVAFTTGNMAVGTAFTVRLDLQVSASATPSVLLSGRSGSLDVDVFGQSAAISVAYEGGTYSKNFTTPIGSLKIPIYDVALGSIYAKVTGSVEVTPEVKGDASISPNTLSWASDGSQSISVAHRVSIFSIFFPDVITVELPLQYVLNVAVGIEALGNTLFEDSVNVGSLTGSPKITQDLTTIPVATIIILVVLVAMVIRLVREKRRRVSVKPPKK